MPRARQRVTIDLYETDSDWLKGFLEQFKAETTSARAAGAAERVLWALNEELPAGHP